MQTEELVMAIKEAISDIAGIDCDNIKESDSYVDDLGLDSLGIIEVVVELQRRFKVRNLPEERLQQIRTIGDTASLLQEYVLASVV